jgi:5-methylcytosine-specific restriction endonuclease McrA
MISIPIKIIESAKVKFKTDIDKFIKNGKLKLEATRNNKRRKWTTIEKGYLTKLINDFENIVLAKPSELETFKTKFQLPNKSNKKKQKKFKDAVIKDLDYTTLRSEFYPKYFQSIGIKSCVYCNAQLTVAVDTEDLKRKKNIKAKFQVDHYIPKSEYPCYSISLFNLYPVCASCNNSKSAKKIKFLLYSETNHYRKSEFEFVLDSASKATFLLNRNSSDIQVKFKQPKTIPGYDDFNKTFDIEGVYDTQKDLVEELILKAEIYTKSYRKSLLKDFNSLLKNEAIMNRLIVGNYTEKDEIHKRPLAKFTQDIAEQLGLI